MSEQIHIGVSAAEHLVSRRSSLVSVSILVLRGFLGAGGVGVGMSRGVRWEPQMLDLG